jgi:hypothetical protein
MPNVGKTFLFKNSYMPILTYGTKTWTWAKADISRLRAAEMGSTISTDGDARRGTLRSEQN